MLGARHGKGYLLSALLGAVTPFCSCSTIPMLRGLLSAKAGFGPTLTFLFISPLLNPIIVGLMWATFGWKVTLLYAVIAASVSVMASMLLDRLGFERHVIDPKRPPPLAVAAVARRPAPPLKQIAVTTNAVPFAQSNPSTGQRAARLRNQRWQNRPPSPAAAMALQP